MTEEKKDQRCSFCGKSKDQVQKLIQGPDAYICDECIHLCEDILRQEMAPKEAATSDHLPTPAEIKATLDDYVIRQELSLIHI